jgi:hypothetical protein
VKGFIHHLNLNPSAWSLFLTRSSGFVSRHLIFAMAADRTVGLNVSDMPRIGRKSPRAS